MRARNREINIFNMSLLDILTGMLGAFLFLMLGLLPYYARVSKSRENPEDVKKLHEQIDQQQQEIADLKKQIQELQQLIKDSGGGPLTAQQVQQLMDQVGQLREQLRQAQNQIQQLQGQNQQIQNQLAQAQQLQRAAEHDRDFWQTQNGVLSIVSTWDSSAADIDVFVIDPDGSVHCPKNEDTLFGKKCVSDGDDSHGPSFASNTEGVMTFVGDKNKDADFLVIYRVSKNAPPASYAGLCGWYFYQENLGEKKGVAIRENTLGDAKAEFAQPGGLYAWAVLHYDAKKAFISTKPPEGFKLPPGVVIPRQQPARTVPAPPVAPSMPATPARPR